MSKNRFWDAAGVSLSALCLVHCLALPVAAALLPLLGELSEAAWVHWAFFGMAAPVTAMAMSPAFGARPLPALMLCAATLGVGLLFAGAINLPSHDWGEGFTIAGGLCLSTAHVQNWRRHRGHAHINGVCDLEGALTGPSQTADLQ